MDTLCSRRSSPLEPPQPLVPLVNDLYDSDPSLNENYSIATLTATEENRIDLENTEERYKWPSQKDIDQFLVNEEPHKFNSLVKSYVSGQKSFPQLKYELNPS